MPFAQHSTGHFVGLLSLALFIFISNVVFVNFCNCDLVITYSCKKERWDFKLGSRTQPWVTRGLFSEILNEKKLWVAELGKSCVQETSELVPVRLQY